jgi:hypothetical protein
LTNWIHQAISFDLLTHRFTRGQPLIKHRGID